MKRRVYQLHVIYGEESTKNLPPAWDILQCTVCPETNAALPSCLPEFEPWPLIFETQVIINILIHFLHSYLYRKQLPLYATEYVLLTCRDFYAFNE